MKPGFIELKRDFLFIADFILFLANICLECKFLAKARMTEINTLPRSLLVLFFYNPHCFAFATVVADDEEKVNKTTAAQVDVVTKECILKILFQFYWCVHR